MKASPPSIARSRVRREGGAVAIVLGLSIFVLFGFLALVIDLGRTYVVRTELQNAADASALAGAKELNQTKAGVDKAVDRAIKMAAQHRFDFSKTVIITSADLSVGSCPDDACMVPVTDIDTDAEASKKTFLKVHIPSGSLATFFAVVPMTAAGAGTSSLSTSGRAVAGWALTEVAPIGVCAHKDPISGSSKPIAEALPVTGELAQFGFRRGVSYNIFALGPLGSPSDTYLLNPIDRHPEPCDPNNSSTNITAPFICTGSSNIEAGATIVYGNAGISAGAIQAALNSRFNDYSAPSVCIPAEAKSDSNIQKYGCTGGSCATPAADWMTPPPTTQTINLLSDPPPSADQYGVLWSYSRAVRAVGTPPGPGAEFTPSDWNSLYPSPTGPAQPASAPTGSFLVNTSPYLDPGHSLAPPASSPQEAHRRVLNLVIADCKTGAITGPAACQTIPVLGIGRFFMQVPAKFTGSPKKLEVEFAGLVDPVSSAEIKLYR